MSASLPSASPAAVTRRAQVVAVLEREIAAGQWPAGERLPAETRLAARFGVSRQTVRQALAELASRGLLRSRQGVGSTVLRQAAVPEFSQSLESIRALVSYARGTRVQLLQMEERALDAAQARLIGAAPGDIWCHSATLRFAADQDLPMGLSSVWVPRSSRQAMLAAHASGLPVFMEIQQASGQLIDQVLQVLGAALPRREQARLLQCGQREPLLRIQRWYRAADGQLLEMSDTLHPQTRFQYAMLLRHSGPVPGPVHFTTPSSKDSA